MKNYYKILRVDRPASSLDIKKSYRDLTIQFHPDRNKAQNAHENFVELNEAFQILSDDSKRKKYDVQYEQYLMFSASDLNNPDKEEFESIKKEARRESEKIADSNFFIFTTEILTEIVGHALFSGFVEGMGTVIKGTGEVIGDVLSGLD